MKLFVLFAFLFVAASVSGNPLNARITGGYAINISDYPWHVSIIYDETEYVCTGSIISSQWLVTSAHCIEGAKLQELTVRAGSTNKNTGGKIFQLAESISHPQYNKAVYGDLDVAVIRIDGTFDGANMAPVQIGTASPIAGQTVLVSGWGALRDGLPSSDVLHAVSANVMSATACKNLYEEMGENPSIISDNKFCSTGGANAGSCYGDGGGSIIDNGKLVGLVSWGMGCGIPNYPDVNTDLVKSSIRDFIKQKTNV